LLKTLWLFLSNNKRFDLFLHLGHKIQRFTSESTANRHESPIVSQVSARPLRIEHRISECRKLILCLNHGFAFQISKHQSPFEEIHHQLICTEVLGLSLKNFEVLEERDPSFDPESIFLSITQWLRLVLLFERSNKNAVN
jgi:hypothetical protein